MNVTSWPKLTAGSSEVSMTISPHEFKKAGEALDPGRRARIEHSCGDGRTLIVSRDHKGISAYCFRCHKKGYIHTERSLAERIAALSESIDWDGVAQESLELPGPGKQIGRASWRERV